MPIIEWTRIAISLKFPNFSMSFRTLLTRRPHSKWAFWILGICKTYCNQISICTWHTTSLHPFCQNNFGPRKSNLHPLGFFSKSHIKVLYTNIFFGCIFFCKVFCITKSQTKTAILILKNDTYPLVSMILDHGWKSSMRCSFADAMFVPMFDAMFVPMFVSKWCSRWVVGMPIFVWNPLKVEIILDHGCLLYMPKPENFQIGFTKKSVSNFKFDGNGNRKIFF